MSGLNKGRKGMNKGRQGSPGWQRVNMSALPGKTPPTAPYAPPTAYTVSEEEAEQIWKREQELAVEAWEKGRLERERKQRRYQEKQRRDMEARAAKERAIREEEERIEREYPIPAGLRSWAYSKDWQKHSELQVRHNRTGSPRFTPEELEEWIDEIERFLPSLPPAPHSTSSCRIVPFLRTHQYVENGHLALMYNKGKWEFVRYSFNRSEYAAIGHHAGVPYPQWGSLREAIRMYLAHEPEAYRRVFWNEFSP